MPALPVPQGLVNNKTTSIKKLLIAQLSFQGKRLQT